MQDTELNKQIEAFKKKMGLQGSFDPESPDFNPEIHGAITMMYDLLHPTSAEKPLTPQDLKERYSNMQAGYKADSALMDVLFEAVDEQRGNLSTEQKIAVDVTMLSSRTKQLFKGGGWQKDEYGVLQKTVSDPVIVDDLYRLTDIDKAPNSQRGFPRSNRSQEEQYFTILPMNSPADKTQYLTIPSGTLDAVRKEIEKQEEPKSLDKGKLSALMSQQDRELIQSVKLTQPIQEVDSAGYSSGGAKPRSSGIKLT